VKGDTFLPPVLARLTEIPVELVVNVWIAHHIVVEQVEVVEDLPAGVF